MKSTREKILLAIVVVGSLVAAVLVRKYGGHRDPTDSGSWYLAMFGLAFLGGLMSPYQAWRWGIAAVAPQWLLAFYPEVSNLWPLSMMFISVLMLPAWLCAWIASRLRTKFDELTGRTPEEPPVIREG